VRTRKSSKSLFEYQPSYLFILVSFFFFAVFLYLIFMIIVICEAKASRLSSSSGAVNGWLAGWLAHRPHGYGVYSHRRRLILNRHNRFTIHGSPLAAWRTVATAVSGRHVAQDASIEVVRPTDPAALDARERSSVQRLSRTATTHFVQGYVQ
jgi:hypothetical protein